MYTNRSKQQMWGRILSGFATLALAGSATAKIAGVPKVVSNLTRDGVPQNAIVAIAVIELTCLALFLIPRTTVLGAFLLTGYFGGATFAHIVGGENVFAPLFVGLVVWIAAWCRVPELQSLLPMRRAETAASSYQPHPAQASSRA